jgi:ligand-binding sensor domain-containing protein
MLQTKDGLMVFWARDTTSYLTAILVLALATVTAAAQSYTPTAADALTESWRWRSFPELKELGLRTLATDGEVLWFGVDDGVWRYDGLTWQAFGVEAGLPGIPVNALCATAAGVMYAGTDMGIYRQQGDRWQRIFPLAPELSWPVDRLIETADGSLWAATAWGALHMGDSGFELYTSGQIGCGDRSS